MPTLLKPRVTTAKDLSARWELERALRKMYPSLKDSEGWLDIPENQLALGSWHAKKNSLQNLEGQRCLFAFV